MGGGRSTSSERGRRDIADIMVVPAKAPGPFAADVENGELLAQQKLADRLVRLFGRTPHHHGREIGRAHAELQSLMRISYAVFCFKKKSRILLTNIQLLCNIF